jgi:predicted nucleic acid-binding protein
LKYYHRFSWGVAFIMSLFLATIRGISGLWYADAERNSHAICWFNVPDSDWNYRIQVFLYVPVTLVYIYAVYVVLCARKILQNGIALTFLHRARAVYMNNIMLIIFLVYNFTLAVLMILTKASRDSSANRGTWGALMYLLSCKGYICLIVFAAWNTQVLATPTDSSSTGGSKTSRSRSGLIEEDASSILFDLNGALQHEVVTYATEGIKHCAKLLLTQRVAFHTVQIKVPSNQFTLSKHALNSIVKDFRSLQTALKDSSLMATVANFKANLIMTDNSSEPLELRPSDASVNSPNRCSLAASTPADNLVFANEMSGMPAEDAAGRYSMSQPLHEKPQRH